MKKRLLVGLIVLGLPIALSFPRATFAKKPVDKQQSVETVPQTGVAYLGIVVEPLHPALITHLPETLVDGQGVLVSQVVPGSPAAKAGLMPHDILVTYDDQKLFSPEQLIKLVRADKVGRDVNVETVRDGKLASRTLRLGEQPASNVLPQPSSHPHWWQQRWWQRLPNFLWQHGTPRARGDRARAWDSFDSLALKKLDDNRYRAEIEYLDKEGNKQYHQFEGRREEIQSQIEAEKDLPANEREHLLRGLDLQVPESIYESFDQSWYDWPGLPREF
jgi:membrane-associated protease RseP (regulator of RpoE activity)